MATLQEEIHEYSCGSYLERNRRQYNEYWLEGTNKITSRKLDEMARRAYAKFEENGSKNRNFVTFLKQRDTSTRYMVMNKPKEGTHDVMRILQFKKFAEQPDMQLIERLNERLTEFFKESGGKYELLR